MLNWLNRSIPPAARVISLCLFTLYILATPAAGTVSARAEATANFARELNGWRMVRLCSGRHMWEKDGISFPVFEGGTGGQIGIIGPLWKTTGASTSANNFSGLTTVSAGWGATEANNQGVMPGPGPWTFGNVSLGVGFRVTMGTAPGGVASWTFNVRANGVNTGITVTITGAAKTASDTTHTYAFSAGDLVSIQSVPAGTPAASSNPCAEFTFEYQAANAGEYPLIECCPNTGTQQIQNLTRYYAPVMDSNAQTTESIAYGVMPESATLGDFYVALTNAPGGTQTVKVRIRWTSGGIAVYGTSAITITGAAKTGNLTGDLLSPAGGDLIDIEVITSATCASTSVRFGIRYTSGTNGNCPNIWPICSLAQNKTQYGWGIFIRDIEATYQSSAPYACTIKNLYIQCAVGFIPAAGQTLTLTGRDGNADQTLSAICDHTGAGNDTTHSWSVAAADLIDIKNVTSLTSGSTLFTYGHLMVIAQPSSGITYPQLEHVIGRGSFRGIMLGKRV